MAGISYATYNRDTSKDIVLEPDNIADAIAAAQGRVADCYTAISNKGGTLPATQNLANMPTAIDSIPSGGGGYTEFPSYQVSNGVANRRSDALTGNEFTDITSIGYSGLYYAFINCTGLTGNLNLSSLTTIDHFGLYYAFINCTGLTGVNLSSLTSVGKQGLNYTFTLCIGLTGSLNLSSLTTVDDSGLLYAFYYCSGLTSVDLSSLKTIGNSGLSNAFSNCTGLTDIYFNSLTTSSFGSHTNQFSSMLAGTGTSVTHTLHFPSNLESTIQGLSGYPTFGGTSGYVVLSFDLQATS